MRLSRRIVLACAGGLFLAWLWSSFGRLTRDQDGLLCLALAVAFSLAILLRRKPDSGRRGPPAWTIPLASVAGVITGLAGIIFGVHQFEWLGVLMIVYACLLWALPEKYSGDIPLSMAVLFFAHPLPWLMISEVQLTMQHLSVRGAEWLLHCFNMPAWGDMEWSALFPGTFRVDVPDMCSGMKTSFTVMLSCLGTCILFRCAWYDFGALLTAGLVQVLVLNIIRIAATAVLAPRMPSGWASGALHDSLGSFLLTAIVLVQIEAALLMSYRRREAKRRKDIAKGVLERRDRGSIFNSFWRMVFRRGWAIAAIALLITGTAGAIYKRRPYHRSRMISRVADDMIVWDLASANSALVESLALDPDNHEARLSLARTLLLRSRFDEALTELQNIPPGNREPMHVIVKAQVLAAKRLYDEAAALIKTLPEGAKRQPRVALVAAEIARSRDDVRGVVDNLPLAARSSYLIHRVRTFFPYLAAREQWATIAAADRDIQYADLRQATIAMDARLRANDMRGMEQALTLALQKWPDHPAFLTHLLAIALAKPGSAWEDSFSRVFLKNLSALDRDHLVSYLPYCFRLKRPDLAWLAYLRLQSLDASDPELFLTAARFGNDWMVFRMHHLGLPSASPASGVDLKPLCRQTRGVWPLSVFWDAVPLSQDLSGTFDAATSEKYLGMCLAEIDRREKTGTFSDRMHLTRATALTMAGRYSEAHQSLLSLEKAYPEKRQDLIRRRLVLYDRQQEWGKAYETAREYVALVGRPDLATTFIQLNALIHLNLGIYALTSANTLPDMFPGSSQAALVRAAVLDTYGSKEDALFVLSEAAGAGRTALAATLLFDTERFKPARRLAQAIGAAEVTRAIPGKQRFALPPAELSIVRPERPQQPTDAQMDQEAARLRSIAERSSSAFVMDLMLASAGWNEARGKGSVSDPAQWERIGRDSMEQACALCELGRHLVSRKQYEEADRVLAKASALAPNSSTIWQLRVALTRGKREVVEEARRLCPSSPEIWLASLVARLRDEGPGTWAATEVNRAVAEKAFSPGTMVRAGDFFLRASLTNAAASAARYATRNGNGLLPAYVLGLRCALGIGDMTWARSCARGASQSAIDPMPFDRVAIDIEMREGGTNAAFAADPRVTDAALANNPEWAERLVDFYFRKGDMRAVANVLAPLIEQNREDEMAIESLIMVAEAERREGRTDKSTELLQRAYARDPGNFSVLNNLTYVLAQDRRTIARAQGLLPVLLASKVDSFSIFDTAAMVYLRADDPGQAAVFMKKALTLMKKGDYAWDEVHLNAAEINLRLGRFGEAGNHLDIVLGNAGRSKLVEDRRLELLDALHERTSGR